MGEWIGRWTVSGTQSMWRSAVPSAVVARSNTRVYHSPPLRFTTSSNVVAPCSPGMSANANAYCAGAQSPMLRPMVFGSALHVWTCGGQLHGKIKGQQHEHSCVYVLL